ncbi:hypothetical protein [Acetivibrio mesophilus]|uniref:Uncharacterized protein n=1 Tax=Acetivibrio mesophilus TaxID=2487273 RepID=A0A4Q0I3B8_9FIRM|nr:hypothetical protein [Acetivibrio mesophilus]ODM27222.1 hypothetical protein A7W90_13940 [Clostridium sp. Bc-iso-3]RXE58743.1 hypothetical protein EFD62_10580 [Acetivibrio mesophilus]
MSIQRIVIIDGLERVVQINRITQEKIMEILSNCSDVKELEDTVQCCGLILERITFKGQKTAINEIDDLNIDDFDGEQIKKALISLLKREIINDYKIIWALSKSFDPTLKMLYLEKLQQYYKTIESQYTNMFQTIIALDNIGEIIIPCDNVNPRYISLLDIQKNIESVRSYINNIDLIKNE